MSPFPMEPRKGVETYEFSRAEYLAAEGAALALSRLAEKPEWTEPVFFLHAGDMKTYTLEEKVDEAAYALSQRHQDDLVLFEAELTKALIGKGMPMVFIQPGAPGHKEAMRQAKKHLVQDFASAEPIRPCDHEGYTKGCRACEFVAVRRGS